MNSNDELIITSESEAKEGSPINRKSKVLGNSSNISSRKKPIIEEEDSFADLEESVGMDDLEEEL